MEKEDTEISLDVGLITAHLKTNCLPITGTIEDKADRLERAFLDKKASSQIELAYCDSCCRWSDASLQQCPFCGDAEPPKPFPEDGIVPTTPSQMKYSQYTAEHLDQAVESIKNSARTAQEEVYKAGKTLELIKNEQLWRFRLDEYGHLKYKDFYEFARKEIGISKSYAARLIRVCSQYTPSQLKKFGVTKLDVSLRLPEPRRKEFLTRAQEMQARGPEITDLAASMQTKGSEEEGGAVPPKIRVPVYMPLGLHFFPMWKRVTDSNQIRIGVPTEPAKNMSESPWTKIWIGKDVVMFIRVTQNSVGELQTVVEIRKGEERPESFKNVLK